MRNISNKIKTLVLTIAAFIISSSGFAQQIEFKDMTLGIIQSIAYTTTYDDIISLGDSKKTELTKKTNTDKTESLDFKIGDREISLRYSKDKKFIYAMSSYNRYSEDNKTVEQLLENNFERTHNMKTDSDAFGPVTWYYNKSGYPYEFAIYIPGYTNTNDVYIFNKEFGTFEKFKPTN